jgi:hypothetical protein
LDLSGEQTAVVPVTGAWTVSFPHAFAPNALAVGAPENGRVRRARRLDNAPGRGRVKFFFGHGRVRENDSAGAPCPRRASG